MMCHQFLIMETKRCVTISKETHTYCGPKRTILYFSDSLGGFLLGNNQRSKVSGKTNAWQLWKAEVQKSHFAFRHTVSHKEIVSALTNKEKGLSISKNVTYA